MNPALIRSIIFDLDGTLIDSSQGIVEAVNYSLRCAGIPERSDSEISRYIGHPLKQMYSDFTDAPYQELYFRFQERAATTVVAATVPLAEVEETLRTLIARGYQLGIATNKISFHIAGILDKLGWNELFIASVGGDEVTHQKPHPEMIQLSLDRMQTLPHQAVMVGDTDMDMLAAHGADVSTIAIESPYGHTLAELPHTRIQHFSDLLTMFGAVE